MTYHIKVIRSFEKHTHIHENHLKKSTTIKLSNKQINIYLHIDKQTKKSKQIKQVVNGRKTNELLRRILLPESTAGQTVMGRTIAYCVVESTSRNKTKTKKNVLYLFQLHW